MITVLRKNQKALFIVIGILCIPFVFYFNKSDTARITHDDLGQIYGRTVSRVEFQRNARLLTLTRELGMFTFMQDMIGGATSQEEAYSEFTWNHLVLHHEAERLGIAPTVLEIAKVVKAMRVFQGEKGGFDPTKYNQFVMLGLPSMGFGEAQVEELAADQLTLEKLKEVVGAGASVAEVETKENYERAYGKLSVSTVRVRSEDLAKEVQVSDDEVAKYFETHKAELKSDEKRKVSFVSFGLDEAQQKLTGKERVEVLQKLADRANDFTQALLEKGAQFDAVAAKFQLSPTTSESFARSTPDGLFKTNPQLTEGAFQLKPAEPNSDALQVGDSFYVLHLAATEEARPLTLEEAKPKVVEAIKKQRVNEVLAAKGNEAVQKIRQALQSGTPADAALMGTGLPMEAIPAFALADPPEMVMEPGKQPEMKKEAPDIRTIKNAVAELNPGETTDFLPTEAGGVIALLEKRDAPDPAKFEQAKASFNARVLKGKRDLAFYEWLRERRRTAGVRPAVEAKGG